MNRTELGAAVREKQDIEAEEVELAQSRSRARQTYYVARTEEERQLDKRLNLKLDVVVVGILALMFIVGASWDFLHFKTNPSQLCGIDKTNVGFVGK
jgi:hypothetical protein